MSHRMEKLISLESLQTTGERLESYPDTRAEGIEILNIADRLRSMLDKEKEADDSMWRLGDKDGYFWETGDIGTSILR